MTKFGWCDWLKGSNGLYTGATGETKTVAASNGRHGDSNWLVTLSLGGLETLNTYACNVDAGSSSLTTYNVQYANAGQWIATGAQAAMGAQTANGMANLQQQAYQYANSAYQQIMTNWYPNLYNSMWDRPETPAEKAAREEREVKRKAASLRAENLLFTILTPAQVRQYTDDACIDVEINGRVYRLHCNSRSGNVTLMENGKPKFKYCAHPKDAHDVPIPDVLVSQLLMLKTNEREFLRLANRTAA